MRPTPRNAMPSAWSVVTSRSGSAASRAIASAWAPVNAFNTATMGAIIVASGSTRALVSQLRWQRG